MKIDELLDIMVRLRDQNGGCPWDIEQTSNSIAHYTLEEAYEVVDAIASGDPAKIKDELGDLLFQVVFHAQIHREKNAFDFGDVVASIVEKMIRRHPHVFADAVIGSAEEQTLAWEQHKAAERVKEETQQSVLDGVPAALPALTRAVKLQKRAANKGFDWPDLAPVFDKLHEELDEVREAIHEQHGIDAIEDELGDVLFVCANLARHLKIDPESAVRRANQKFERRFRGIERTLAARGKNLEDATLAEMDAIWDQMKALEKRAE